MRMKFYLELSREQFMSEIYGKLPRMTQVTVSEMRGHHAISVKPERFRLGRTSEISFSDLQPHKLTHSSEF